MVLHVWDAPLVRRGAVGTQKQRRATGGPHVLRAEIQLAAPRQPNADAQVDAAPALILAQRRTGHVRLEHVPDDRTTHGTMLDAEAEGGLVERIIGGEAGARQKPDVADAGTEVQAGI